MSAAAAKRTALVAATLVALLGAMIVGSAGGAPRVARDKVAPTAPADVHVVSATPTSVSVAWAPSQDNVGISGYYVYGDLYGTASRLRVASASYTVQNAECGSSVSIDVVAFDSANNRSTRASALVSTAPCPDLQPPTAPSGFRQTVTTQSSVVLEWAPSVDNVGVVLYGVYRGAQLIGSPAAPADALSGLSCGSTTQFQVDAIDASGNRSPRSSIWVTTAKCLDGEPPSAPTGLSMTSRTGRSVSLSWSASNDNVGVTGYRLSVGGVPVVSVTGTASTATGLACGRSYVFGVDASDAAGNRSSAATVTAATSPCAPPPPPPPSGDGTPPSQPSGLAVTGAAAASVSLSWSAATDNVGVTGYDVFVNGVKSRTVSGLTATVSGLSCGIGYALGVEALDAAGNHSARASVTASTSPCVDAQAPSPPQGVTATPRTTTSIALSWSASSDNVGVAGYGLYRGGVLQASSSTTTGLYTGLACNSNYTLAVDAADAAGNRSAKTTLMVSTTACPDTTPPSTPAGLVASNVTQSGATLGWGASSDNVGVTGYDVYRGGSKVTSVTSPTSSQTGLSCGMSYTFGVIARDGAGNSSGTAQLAVTTSACSTPPPTSGWAFCANENKQCTFAGTKEVRYGANGTFTAPRTFAAIVLCANSVFGDPIPNVIKYCEYRDPTSPAPAPAPTPTPTPTPSGQSLSSFSDFKNNVFTQIFERRWANQAWSILDYVGTPWSDGSGVYEISTPNGPGFRMVQNESVARGSGALVGMADVDHILDQQNYIGTTTELSGKMMFPRSGNPNGFPAFGDWNILWEFTQSTVVHNVVGIDALAPSGPTIYVRAFDSANPGNRNGRKARASSPLQYDRWYDWRWQIKWSEGSDGFVNFWFDGQQIAAFTGPSVQVSGGAPYLEWGWYGGYDASRNEVQYSSLRRA